MMLDDIEADVDDSLIGETFASPVVRFVEPAGPEGVGKTGMTVGPVSARVGRPVRLAVSIAPQEEHHLVNGSVRWGKFQGPRGEVMFTSKSESFQAGDGLTPLTSTTEATFSEPGDYLVIVQVLQGSYGGQCCWTNGYVRVAVSR